MLEFLKEPLTVGDLLITVLAVLFYRLLVTATTIYHNAKKTLNESKESHYD